MPSDLASLPEPTRTTIFVFARFSARLASLHLGPGARGPTARPSWPRVAEPSHWLVSFYPNRFLSFHALHSCECFGSRVNACSAAARLSLTWDVRPPWLWVAEPSHWLASFTRIGFFLSTRYVRVNASARVWTLAQPLGSRWHGTRGRLLHAEGLLLVRGYSRFFASSAIPTVSRSVRPSRCVVPLVRGYVPLFDE